jgi:hypothetical protein
MNNHEQPERRPEGKEGAGAHQQGPNSVQAGQTQRREQSSPESKPKQAGDKRSTHQRKR